MSGQAVISGAPERLVIKHLGPTDFHLDGLRPYAEYRDFGFAQATNGAMTAHVLRFFPSYKPEVAGKRHIHDVDFQMVFLFNGWISYEFEGVGPITMHPGDAWTQPPGIRHTVTGYSDYCELLELVMPVEYDTVDVDPVGTTPDATTPVRHLLKRQNAPQRFVVSHPSDAAEPVSGYPRGALLRDFGFASATNSLVTAGELRLPSTVGESSEISSVPLDSLRLGYVTAGEIVMAFDGSDPITMKTGTCWLEPPGTKRVTTEAAAGASVMQLTARLSVVS